MKDLTIREDQEFVSPAFIHDPYPFYARWQRESPIWWSDRMDGWVVSRYDDVRKVLGQYKSFVQSPYFEGALVDAFDALTLVAMNPPQHTETRRKAEPVFRPSALEARMAEFVERIVDDLIADLPTAEPFGLTAQITSPLVMRVMAELMGTENSERLGEIYRALLQYLKEARYQTVDDDVRERGRDAGRRLITYLSDLGDGPSGSPLYDALVESGISREHALAACALTLVGGVETTVRGLANTVHALTTNEGQLTRVRADPAMASPAFDEGLRWVSPIQLKARQAASDVDLHEQHVKAGDTVFTLLGAANRDARHYPDPEIYDLDRRSADHLAFGSGVHYCIGAPLAKLEARSVIERLLTRYDDLRLVADREIVWDGPIYRSPQEVWLVGR